MTKKIIINADDFGFTKETNRGIIETIEKGVTTEVNLMVNCYGSLNAMKYAKDNNYNNVGIHLHLFNTDNGDIPFRNKDYDNALNNWTADKLLEKIKGEISKFEDFFGTTPSHINGHKQLHFNPKIIDFILDYAKSHNIYVRKWGDFETTTVVNNDIEFVKEKFKQYNVKTSDYLFGFEYDFLNPEKATNNYKHLIDTTEENALIELLFHPGYYGRFEETLTSFLKERETDRKLLCSKEFKDMLSGYACLPIRKLLKPFDIIPL